MEHEKCECEVKVDLISRSFSLKHRKYTLKHFTVDAELPLGHIQWKAQSCE